MANRRRFEVVTDLDKKVDAGEKPGQRYHARLRGGNSTIIAHTEQFKTKRSAYNAVRAIAETFSFANMVWLDGGSVTVSLDGEQMGSKLTIPIVEVDER